MSPTKSRSTTRRRVSRKTAAVHAPKPRALASIAEVSARKRANVFRAFRKVLKEHGLSDDVSALHFEPAAPRVAGLRAASAAAAATPRADHCPPRQGVRIVCFRRPDGTVVCEPRCQPV